MSARAVGSRRWATVNRRLNYWSRTRRIAWLYAGTAALWVGGGLVFWSLEYVALGVAWGVGAALMAFAMRPQIRGDVLRVRRGRKAWGHRDLPLAAIAAITIPHPFTTPQMPTLTLTDGEVVPLWTDVTRAQQLAVVLDVPVVQGARPVRSTLTAPVTFEKPEPRMDVVVEAKHLHERDVELRRQLEQIRRR